MREVQDEEMPNHSEMIPIDAFDHLSVDRFRQDYWNEMRPVVIRDLSSSWPARSRWTIEYMRKRLGSFEVPLYKTGAYDPSAPVNAPYTTMLFSDYMDLFKAGTDLRIFLLNPLKLSPSMSDDFSTPSLGGGFIKSYPTLFFGARGSRVFLHYDIDMSHVFHTHFGGRKKVVLYSPDESALVYKIPFSVRSFMDNDPENADYERYPAMRYAKAYETTLTHGDTLFMPSGWWHHMRYVDSGFALSQRAVTQFWGKRMTATSNLFVVRPLETVLRRLGGNSWRQFKDNLAMRRGRRHVRRMEASN